MARGLPIDGVIQVGSEEYDLDEAYRDLRVDEVHIIDQISDQPSLFAWWATLAEEANTIAESRRRQLDLVEAELDEEIREEAREASEKITEATVNRRIIREDRYQKAWEKHRDAKRAAALLGVIRRAVEQRLSALIAINNRDRSEMAQGSRD
jgi:hypothetical protein